MGLISNNQSQLFLEFRVLKQRVERRCTSKLRANKNMTIFPGFCNLYCLGFILNISVKEKHLTSNLIDLPNLFFCDFIQWKKD